MNVIDYKNKYIKYKMKYLDLINQYAGTDPKVVLLCSHQGRLACLIHDLTGNKLVQNFKNCCIIKLSKIEKDISLQIVHEGELVFECTDAIAYAVKAEEEDKYYKNNEIFKLNQKAKDIINFLFPNNVVIYMVRHGDGEHLALKRKGVFAKIGQNIKDRFKSSDKQILRDARLTEEGIIQAQLAGKALKTLLGNKKIDYIFFSDLERTRQTIAGMLSQIQTDKIPNRAIVLHCSHEVGYKKDGSNCDGERILDGIKRGLIIENLPKVDKIQDFQKDMQINEQKKISIDINRYSNFYNPNTQTESKKVLRHKSSSKNKCKNLTMLQQIAAVVNSPPIV
jgi:broad specificity phosphatase PhoE